MKGKIFERKEDPIFLLEQMDVNLPTPYKEYFNTTLSKKKCNAI